MAELPKADIAKQALASRGALILVKNRAEGINIINQVAPEHLELSLNNPEEVEQYVRHAGAVFLGRHTPEAIGDYCAGSNHVLPTSGTARFSSPLGVYDFTKKNLAYLLYTKWCQTFGKKQQIFWQYKKTWMLMPYRHAIVIMIDIDLNHLAQSKSLQQISTS